ncbi:MAG: ECF-type sigma factor [Planctomycetota bacterium]
MQSPSESRIGGILARANGGDIAAWDELFRIVWDEWHALAHAKLRRESSPHTLETSALVNEAWMRIQREGRLDFQNTRHLHGAVDQAMNRVLVDHARGKARLKRGAEFARVDLHDAESTPAGIDLDLATALEEFQAIDARAASVALFRFAYGYTNDEVAAILGIAPRTVREDWRIARAWLRSRLG